MSGDGWDGGDGGGESDANHSSGGDDAATVRAYLLREHRPLLAAVLDCAEAVAEADGTALGDATDRFERALRDRGVVDALPDVLSGAVAAIGASLPAEPVAAPPYVVVTRSGPVARATLPERGRLVLTVAAFARRDGTWARTAETPEEALTVELR
ncbi:hypothetical protein ACFPYI_07170 [Halomarina salina]|uniref:DUF7988 domain-containing protein n=1 Tax=Halomarina salina TaxID=1872699 RepID=A0ABD5RLN2_9EURY|nr:hypothetical protein [Halomarina salina]